jgi:hypothetical protein
MKKIFLIAILLAAGAPAVQAQNIWSPNSPNVLYQAPSSAGFSGTAVPTGTLPPEAISYTPLEPFGQGGVSYGTGGLPQYLKSSYNILLSLGTIVGIVILILGGIQYMLSDSVFDKDKAKKSITAAVWGMSILLGSYLILYTINPDILTFRLITPSNINIQYNWGAATSTPPPPVTTTLTSEQKNSLQNYFNTSPLACVITLGCPKTIIDSLVVNGTWNINPWSSNNSPAFVRDFINTCTESGGSNYFVNAKTSGTSVLENMGVNGYVYVCGK